MTPESLELLLYLHVNEDLWTEQTVSECMRGQVVPDIEESTDEESDNDERIEDTTIPYSAVEGEESMVICLNTSTESDV